VAAVDAVERVTVMAADHAAPESRCLKRYIARELYRCLNTAMAA
jgi:hypothetical protein